MGVADISLLTKQTLEKLLAMPRQISQRYTLAIGTDSEYVVLTEITDSGLIIDESICIDIVSAPAGHPYANQFQTLTAALSSGDKIAAHVGSYGDVKVAVSGVYAPSIAAKSREEILRMIDNATLYGGPSRHHFIENNFIYHSGDQGAPACKLYYPIFTKTALCQSPDAYSEVLLYGTIQAQQKRGADSSFFKDYREMYMMGRQMIKAGAEFIPTADQLMMARRAA